MKKALIISSLTLVVIFLSAYYLVATPGGLSLLIGFADSDDLQVSVEVKAGSLLSGFELENVKAGNISVDVSVKNLRLKWDFLDFLFSDMQVQSLEFTDLVLFPKSQTQELAEPLVIPDFSINHLSVNHLQVQGNNDSLDLTLDQVSTKLQVLNNKLVFTDFQILKQNIELVSSGSILLNSSYTMSVTTDIGYTTASGRRLDGSIVIAGGINQLVTTLEIPNGNATILVSEITTSPVWSADLSLSEFRPDQIDATLPEIGLNIDLNMEGTATTATGNSAINLDYSGMSGTGDAGDLDTSGLPDEFQLGFDTRLNSDEQEITFNELSISSGGNTLVSSGAYNFQENQFTVTINWQELLLTVSENISPLAVSGTMTLEGVPDSYQVVSNISLIGEESIPPISLTIRGRGNLDGLSLDPLDVELLQGNVSAGVDVSWGDTLEAHVDWVGEGLNPAEIWSEWTGDLDTSGVVQLSRVNGVLSWTTDEIRISGQLKNTPLELTLTGNSMVTGGIDLSAMANYANLDIDFNGTLGEEVNISWEINSPNLTRVDGSLAGSLSSSGQIIGPRVTPRIDAEINASELRTPWGNSKKVSATVNSGVDSNSNINADIHLEEVLVDSLELESLDATVDGIRSSHNFRLFAGLPEMDLQVSGLGNFDESTWHGLLQDMDIVHTKLDSWHLEDPTEMQISTTRILTRPLCMLYMRGSVCAEGQYSMETSDWSIEIESNQVPLSLLQSELSDSLQIDGRANILFKFNGQGSRPGVGMIRADVSDGNILLSREGGTSQSIPLIGSFLQLDLVDGEMKTMVELPAINENFKPVSVNLVISGYEDLKQPPLELPMSGELVAGGNDLSLLTILTPKLESLHGSFDIDIDFSGTIQEPVIQGRAEIMGASCEFLDLGIGITDINLVGTNTTEGVYEINGQLNSGDGAIHANASVQQISEQGIELTASLSGENFEIVNLPEVWAIIDPDVQSRLTVSDQYYQGSIVIPAGIIDLDEAVAKPVISNDEIVDGSKVNEERDEVNQHINVNIELGDDVEIKGMGISGKLAGKLFLSNIDTNNVLVADGEVEIKNAKYSAYGQELTITEGRLIYNKVSLENPIISVRATRSVDDITVGVAVNGYISNPVVTLFSSSNLPQEEILSYIVFGRPLNSLTSGEGQDLIGAATALGIQKSGLLTEKLASMFGLDQLSLSGTTAQNASIMVGKYINPRLYLSYGLGIVDRVSTARLNYKLSNRFSLEAERGQETGFDVFYNLEK